MNVSLTPNDTLGRMLHTFQCTAYEIAEWNFKNLVNANLIELPENSTTNLKIGQIAPSEMLKLSKEEFKNNYPGFTIEDNTNISFGKSAYNVNLTEATPGTTVGLVFSQGNKEQPMVSVEIGGTGAYYIQTREYPSPLRQNPSREAWWKYQPLRRYRTPAKRRHISCIDAPPSTPDPRRQTSLHGRTSHANPFRRPKAQSQSHPRHIRSRAPPPLSTPRQDA